ncbi:peritrophin-1-like [Aplysia californica]|uniref:Peritrophin-1-like n=1 Tax=Aplysia californica TaxID=6500 RepID=A0ABM0ZVC8_APLCA|nr:peritrophin-1-like [Aplysia californica]
MNAMLFVAALVLGLACAAPSREKRQIQNCVDPFRNVPSPCQNNPTNQVYFPHPTDNSKFLQCDVYDRMYIIQCPVGEVFDATLTACRPRTATVTTAPFRPPIYTAAPITQAPATNNPCTATAISRGQVYFAIATDKNKFIECDLAGNPNVLACPTGLFWEQGLLSCVYPLNAGGAAPLNPVSTLTGSVTNPCNAQAINSGHFFFPHPNPAKFIQCDLWGQVFEVDCPAGLLWNAYQETCYSPSPISG